ncbi:uncharacterized protein LOC107776176 [Nicotiana tabacum]|uniref:Uncharacterized protein LOC107776176 n=1 Tax=Nicotiana tabacum TaxID=4097 RepID=A0A1S3YGX7_TOBAC
MRDPMHHHSLFEQERGLKLQLEKWVLVEESMLKQKSRVQWLKLGDANNAYFFASMKNRIVHNQIRRLETAEGHTIINHKDIEAEVTHFCHRLLGLSTTKIYVVQQDVMEEGCKLTRAQQLQLIGLVSKEEISNALKEINDQKAPRYDGFNSLFFKKSCQETFVPRRDIAVNIILNHELVKGYDTKGMSPRCMLKVDLQKAYNSIEWIFIEQVLQGMQFPTKFIKWIMVCLQTVSYSIIINGKPMKPFAARKGLRQGDLMSPFLFVPAMEYFSRMLKIRASRLIANPSKSSIYFCGVKPVLKQQILNLLGFSFGELPVRYLGVPMSSKRESATNQKCHVLSPNILLASVRASQEDHKTDHLDLQEILMD